jgi:hypothetical protein
MGLAILAPATATADSGIFNGIYQQGCNTIGDSCGPLGGVAGYGGDPPVPSWTISTPHYSLVSDGLEQSAADTQLTASLSPGSLHAYATSGVTLTNPQTGLTPGAIVNSGSSLAVSSLDELRFFSSTLPAGTDVSFELTGILHSTIAADQAGDLDPSSLPRAFAAMRITAYLPGGHEVQSPPGAFYHSSNGDGSDLMTVTQVVHTTLGGPDIGLVTDFQISAYAELDVLPGIPYTQTVRQTVDASDTGLIVIKVLTPGVSFASDSGYNYAPPAPVPEPASWTLFVAGLGVVGASLRRLRVRTLAA